MVSTMTKKKAALESLEASSKAPEAYRHYLSLGCPLLNLAVSGDWKKGMKAGTYCLYTGDSSSGKTLVTLAMLAEAANDPNFDDYELWHIDAEVGSFFDFERFFGKKAAGRIKVKKPEGGNPMLLEDVYDFLEAKLRTGIRFVAVIDSMDALSSEAKEKQIEQNAKLRAEGKETKGSYGDGKAKLNSSYLPRLVQMLEHSGSILISISQVRDNIDAGLYGPQKIRSGGHAIKFAGSLEIWTAPGTKIVKEYKGKKRIIGIKPVFTIKKNRISGKERSVVIPILPEFGVDSLGASIDYLIDEGAWTVSGGRINCPLYDKGYYREDLIRKIEDDGKEDLVYIAMQECFDDIEANTKQVRKPRYE